MTLLEDVLHRNDPVAFLGKIVAKELRLRLSGRRVLNTSELSLFRLDIIQLVYSFLKLKGIQTHKLYTGKTDDSLLMHSLSSIEDFEEYLRYLVHTALDYRDFAAQPKSVVEEIKQYIHAHYGEDLSRNELAEIVDLHPDYLARLFKRESSR
ncbi:hypothetical protein J25TS5_37910 [Paenibacillus faecis]|uniref:hypothetical protein n=1 Tax=Paenibacillus faecis TaxID=862114 RepID=UPI001B109123|nr:hypothetical protein [Paenibacillus faecis]GIO86859.1 hypothetical protein J25TS5_37910 [Paenibacillus faecis]